MTNTPVHGFYFSAYVFICSPTIKVYRSVDAYDVWNCPVNLSHLKIVPMHRYQEDGVEADDGTTQEDCLTRFSSRDYIMEPTIFNTLKT